MRHRPRSPTSLRPRSPKRQSRSRTGRQGRGEGSQGCRTEAADAPHGPGSHAALKNGEAPEGLAIKGNADSGKYHTPDSHWYAQTVAEVWFDTVESAEAAGFTAAGAK